MNSCAGSNIEHGALKTNVFAKERIKLPVSPGYCPKDKPSLLHKTRLGSKRRRETRRHLSVDERTKPSILTWRDGF